MTSNPVAPAHRGAPTPNASPGPGPIEPTATTRFTSRDGTALYGEWFEAPAARAAAIVIHGYGEHCGRYREVAHVFRDSGLSVLSYDMRGHGRAGGQRGHIGRFSEYLDDLDAATGELRARWHGRESGSGNTGELAGDDRALPLLAFGHSNGGLVLLRALAEPARRPPEIRAAVLSSPFLGFKIETPAWKRLLGRAASRIAPTLTMPSGLPIDHLTHDPERRAARRADSLCHDVATARWFTETTAAQEWMREHAARIDVPTLWVVAGGDLIADPAATREVHRLLESPSQYVELEEMHHEVVNEVGRARVFALLRDFVAENFPVK